MNISILIDRATMIFKSRPLDRNGEAMSPATAWGEAVAELINTDRDALAIVQSILTHVQLNAEATWYDGTGESFYELISGCLILNGDPFIERIKRRCPDHEATVEQRRASAPSF